MPYPDADVSESSFTSEQTEQLSQARIHHKVSDSMDTSDNLTIQEIEKIKESLRVHGESLSLLGQ